MKPIYIFTCEPAQSIQSAIDTLGSIPYLLSNGYWHGKREQSLIVNADNWQIVKTITESSNQESVLFVDNERAGYFLKPSEIAVDNLETVHSPAGWLCEVSHDYSGDRTVIGNKAYALLSVASEFHEATF